MIDMVEAGLTDVMLNLPSCPEFTAEGALRRAARHLCQQTHCWRHTTEAMPVIKGLREVELDLPRDTRVVRVWWATLAGERLSEVSASRMDTEEGRPTGYALSPSGSLMLDCLPQENRFLDGVVLHASLMPARTSGLLPDDLDPFLEAVVAKASADLLLMPNTEWGDRHAAADQLGIYQSYLTEARRHGEQYNRPLRRTVKYGGI